MNERGALLQYDFHGAFKLVKRDDAIVVFVDLTHDLVPDLLAALRNVSTTEDLLQLFLAHSAVAVDIKHAEGSFEILARQKHVFLESCRDELSVVDATISVRICGREHFTHVWLLQVEDRADLLHASLEFIEREEAIVVCVKRDEHLPHVSQLFSLGLQIGDDGAHSRLERRRLAEGCQIGTDIQLLFLRERVLLVQQGEPLKLKQIVDTWTISS